MAKIRFFAAYALSVLLILVLFSSFLIPASGEAETIASSNQKESFQEDDAYVEKKASLNQEDESYMAIRQMLQQRMERLDSICSKVASDKSATNLALLQEEEVAFYTGIESIRIEAALLPDAKKGKEIEALLESFSRAAAKQVSLAMGAASPDENNSQQEQSKNLGSQNEQRMAELEDQNRLLREENNQLLAALQNRTNAPAPVAQRELDSRAADWKEKYERLKTDNDKLKESNNKYVTQANELKKSYKEVVEDNRRLLAQLQAARATRN